MPSPQKSEIAYLGLAPYGLGSHREPVAATHSIVHRRHGRRGRSSLSPQGPPGGTRRGQTEIPFPPRRRRRRRRRPRRSSQPPEPHASANSSNLRPRPRAANHPRPLIKKPSRYRAYLRSTVTSQTWEAPFGLWANLYAKWSFTSFPRSCEPVPTRRLRNYRVRGRPPCG
jgi:hypothetical protein